VVIGMRSTIEADGNPTVTVNHTVAPVTNLDATDANGEVTLTWTNGQSYDSIHVSRYLGSPLTLDDDWGTSGSATSFVDTSPPTSCTVTYIVVGMKSSVVPDSNPSKAVVR
jgi:hypothetical protein